MFRYTDRGDLTPFISNYFDTNTGPKREAKSYTDIADALETDAAEMLMVSDIPAELDAARTGGLQTALSVRPGNALIEGDLSHRIVESFETLD